VTAAELLAASGRFTLAPGLTDAELTGVEKEFGFSFAPDHRAFLAAGLPTGRGWPGRSRACSTTSGRIPS